MDYDNEDTQDDADPFGDADLTASQDRPVIDWTQASDADVLAAGDLVQGKVAATPAGAASEVSGFLDLIRAHGPGVIAVPTQAAPAERPPVDFGKLSDDDFSRVSTAIGNREQLAAGDPMESLVADQIAASEAWEDSFHG